MGDVIPIRPGIFIPGVTKTPAIKTERAKLSDADWTRIVKITQDCIMNGTNVKALRRDLT